MLKFEIPTAGAETTRQAATAIGRLAQAGDLFVLEGPLGAGKTTFTQGFARALEVRGNIASPTFVISRVHRGLNGSPDLVHVDAYRLDQDWDIEDLDLDSDLEHSVMLVEWGKDRVEHLVESYALVELKRAETYAELVESGIDLAGEDYSMDEERSLQVTFAGPRFTEVAAEISAALLAAGFTQVEA